MLQDAYDWGLVAAVVPPEDLHKAAEGIALEIADNDAAMVRAYKSTLNTG
jgi:enoyl-CoA hydratase/carnithine racemase